MTLPWKRGSGGPAGHQPVSEENAEFWASLARRVGQGDADAEAELARRFELRIRLMASVCLHGSDAAADVTQDTLLALLQALRAGALRQPEKLPAFVVGIARNIINHHFREAARGIEVGGDPPGPGSAHVPADSGIDAERGRLVRGALTRLKRLDRRILLLTLVDGLTPREIAPVVGLSPEVVRTRKSRAIRMLRRDIAERDTNPTAAPHR